MIFFRKLILYFNTLRFLKINQIYNYLIFYIKKYFISKWFIRRITNLSSKQNPSIITLKRKPFVGTSHNILKNSFNFLNREVRFQGSIDWNDTNLTKLWLYNLHYFDYLLSVIGNDSEKSFNRAKSLVLDWIESNPVGYNNGWEPYPLSLRIVNWIYFYLYNQAFIEKDIKFKTRFLNSLYQQCSYLLHFIEFHIKANHLFKNAKAIVIGGYFFEKNEWITKGQRILSHELEEQILQDGGHFEHSPMYHSIILEDILDIINFTSGQKYVADQLKFKQLMDSATKMLIWLETLIQPDSEIPLFGDSAFKISLQLEQLKDYYQEVCKTNFLSNGQSRLESLDSTGYYIFRSSDQYLIIDGGKLSVDYQPGHAHCDLFSFEYTYKSKRFIVDSGPGEYINTELRQKARSIYGHNCMVVNGLDQAEIWQSFRMGRRVRSGKIEISRDNDRLVFRGCYKNNLSRLYSYRHQREVLFKENKFFVIIDKVEANRVESLENIIHTHPGCKIDLNKGIVNVSRGEDTIYIFYNIDKLKIRIVDWLYTPEFGKIVASKKIVFEPKNITHVTMCYLISPYIYEKEAKIYFNQF
jgi:uncharacterized heparinase superfamily protein